MKKQIVFPLLTMVLLMAVGSANAQLGSAHEVRANVPFDYQVGKATMKAGDCAITRAGNGDALAIRCNGSQAALILTGSVSSKPAPATKLVFNKYGDQYFLSQLWIEGSELGVQFPKTHVEKEMMSRTQPESVAILAQR
jgi:hypothetical protein